MNITKKQWTIIGIVVAIILVWYFFLRKKKAESNFTRKFGRVSVGLTPTPVQEGSMDRCVPPLFCGKPPNCEQCGIW